MGRLEREVIEARVELRELRADIAEIKMALEGPPRDQSIRGRLHVLETSDAAAKAAEAALATARALHAERGDRGFSRKERIAAAATGLGLLVCSIVTTFYVVASNT